MALGLLRVLLRGLKVKRPLHLRLGRTARLDVRFARDHVAHRRKVGRLVSVRVARRLPREGVCGVSEVGSVRGHGQ